MSNINLNELRDRSYKTACDHGLHDKELLENELNDKFCFYSDFL